jgi:hypothetical protein
LRKRREGGERRKRRGRYESGEEEGMEVKVRWREEVKEGG